MPPSPAHFDPANAGTLAGRVTWSGALPHADPVTGERSLPDGRKLHITRPTPNLPAVDPAGRGVAGAVVFLRGVNPASARPWDHPPVTIELYDDRPMVWQGDELPMSVGFARRGDAVTMASRQPLNHALRARGAAFFTLTFPDPDEPRTRRFDQAGLVELSSAAGHFWMHGYLFVDDHPYYARTDSEGRWTLSGVPAGEYEAVCWLPDWHVRRHERDPETGVIVRLFFGPPHEWMKRVVVRAGGEITVEFVAGK
jgi:hypothetical protein